MTWGIAAWRRAVQALAFLVTGQWLLMGFLRCPFGVPFVACASCPLGDCSGQFLFLPFLVIAFGGALLAGRVFCGWVCPLGFLQDAIGMVRRRRPKMAGERRGRLRMVSRFLALGVCVWLVFRYNFPVERAHAYVVRSTSVWDWQAVSTAWALGLVRYPIRAVLLLLALAGALLLPRLWCRWLCPLGALLSLGNRFAPLRLRLNKEACTSCMACRRTCHVDTMPGTTDCVSCGECVPVCPEDAVAAGRSRTGR
jgi:polyferredoxin